MHVLQWSANENAIMERGKQLLEPEDAASKSTSGERERLEQEMRKFEAEIHGPSSHQPAMKAPNTKADLEAEIARNTEETSMDEMRALQGPYEARVRKLLRLHRNNLLYRNLLGMLSGEEKESKEQLKKNNWARTLRLVKLLKEMEKEFIKEKGLLLRFNFMVFILFSRNRSKSKQSRTINPTKCQTSRTNPSSHSA